MVSTADLGPASGFGLGSWQREAWKRIRGEWKMDLRDFLVEKMWETEERGTATAEDVVEVEVVEESGGSQMRRWLVRMRRPDLREGKEGRSSHSRSAAETSERSISFGRSTGRPLPVCSTVESHCPLIEEEGLLACEPTS
jgi:hypothetical protein